MLNLVSSTRSFNGYQKIFSFASHELASTARFGVYLPDGYEDKKFPVLFYLSGLTCTENNFIEKSGFQRFASKYKIIVVNPDTSPRGVDIEGDSDAWYFGKGAGFYVDSVVEKWKKNYRMYSYVSSELVEVVKKEFNCDENKFGIFGHSMGGHGALVIGLRNPHIFKTISTFSAICHPSNSPWGNVAFKGYLGDDKELWKKYDATEIAKNYSGPKINIFMDQGSADGFLEKKELLPEDFLEVKNEKINVDYKLREGYDHSYFYIATFIEEHFAFHSLKM
ncbi:S-formylglutathione hydrolase [Strongyloides ratti]|uniref:S-formylglutathione hydrolase n=1 Tax=Strongyloides ratti TaxID=34506 RepID=A0A090LGB1_STRRB|nr:S-formylglutathione hydrolase [Strongyloides ratti]CEF66560.1 S-formylglutathione hydrolase [Strongyloides ratti]